MTRLLWIFFIYQTLSAHCLSVDFAGRQVSNAGEPLFLTPYLKRGALAEARLAARVALPGLPITSYAGYFTVNSTHDSNQFLWYIPSLAPDSAASPVLLWLNGGPGASSLYGLFEENGPFVVINDTIQLREYHWARNHHIIYIDSPVGAGFSFTRNASGYCTDQTQVAEQLYSTLTQFFKLFPELQQNSFFITGESYAGKYIPALALAIHKKNPFAEPRINLQGLVIGNGWCDPEHQLVYSEYLYEIGLVDWQTKQRIKQFETDAVSHIHKQEWREAYLAWHKAVPVHNSLIYNFLGLRSNVFQTFSSVLQSNAIRKAIHVGHMQYNISSRVAYNYLFHDVMQSAAPWIAELLDHYQVVLYSGQLDVIVPHVSTTNFLRNLSFSGAEEYRRAERREWVVDGEVAGYVRRAGRLAELLVRRAGHMVPRDQPAWAWDMITRVTHNQTFGD